MNIASAPFAAHASAFALSRFSSGSKPRSSFGLLFVCLRVVLVNLSIFAIVAIFAAPNAAAEIDLEINGVDDEVEENIQLHFSRWEDLPADNLADIESQTRPALQEALRALGYYEAQVAYALDGGTLVLNIEPGEPVRWAEPQIVIETGERELSAEALRGASKEVPKEAPQDPALPADELLQLLRNHPFNEGRRINHQSYDSYKRDLLTRANQLGYLDARLLQNQLRINPEQRRARVRLRMALGQRYRIEDVTFHGSETNDELLRRIAEVPVGEWFSADQVGEIYNRLQNSGYFASVNIDLDRRPPDATGLNIHLVDLATWSISTGVGVDTNVGPFFRVEANRPRVNERGDSFNAQLRLSAVEQEVSSRYRIPWDHPQNRYVSWDTGWQRTLTDDTQTKVLTTGLAYHRVLDSGWQYSYRVDLENETSKIEGEEEQSQTYVIPGVSASRRRFSGDPIDPDKGYKFWLNFSSSSTRLGSDTNFNRIQTGATGILKFAELHSVLTRFEIGAIRADDFSQVPISQRFFAGGDQSIRGYAYQSISPEEDGVKTGGQYLNAGSVEYRYAWAPKWRAAFFVDSGRAYNDESEPVRTSAGFGVRWKSPVGFIAVDVAAPIGEEDEDISPVRLHFYIATPL